MGFGGEGWCSVNPLCGLVLRGALLLYLCSSKSPCLPPPVSFPAETLALKILFCVGFRESRDHLQHLTGFPLVLCNFCKL